MFTLADSLVTREETKLTIFEKLPLAAFEIVTMIFERVCKMVETATVTPATSGLTRPFSEKEVNAVSDKTHCTTYRTGEIINCKATTDWKTLLLNVLLVVSETADVVAWTTLIRT